MIYPRDEHHRFDFFFGDGLTAEEKSQLQQGRRLYHYKGLYSIKPDGNAVGFTTMGEKEFVGNNGFNYIFMDGDGVVLQVFQECRDGMGWGAVEIESPCIGKKYDGEIFIYTEPSSLRLFGTN